MSETDYNSKNLNLENLTEIKEVEIFKDHLIFDIKTIKDFALVLIETNSTEEENLTVISSFYNKTNPLYIDIFLSIIPLI